MTESTEQSLSERMELPFTKDSNDPALSKLIPIVPQTEFIAAIKLCRKEQQSSIVFERNAKCEPVLCCKSCSEEELKAQLLALAKEWLNQTLYTEFITAVTDQRNPYTLTKLPAAKIIVDNDSGNLYVLQHLVQACLDKDTAAKVNQKEAAKVDDKFGHWDYKITLPLGTVSIYSDVFRLMLAQSEKMGACLSDVVRHMTLAVPAQAISSLMAKQSIFSSAYDMLKVAFPELKIITLPELTQDKEQFALLLCDDPAYGKPGYLVLRDGQPIKAFDPDERITAVKYELSIPDHKLVITNPEQIAVLEGI